MTADAAEVRAAAFLEQRMGNAAWRAFLASGHVDVPIPDGRYANNGGCPCPACSRPRRLTNAALRINHGAHLTIVSRDTGDCLGTCCIYVVGEQDNEGSRWLPIGDKIYALWAVARTDAKVLFQKGRWTWAS